MVKVNSGVRGAAVGFATLFCATTVSGGTGTLEPVPSREHFDKIAVSATIYVEQPRTSGELDSLKDRVEVAAKLLCDSTDELISLEHVTLVDQDSASAWGPNPPFRTPVFVLTHHTRPSIEMEGGTTFHFINASPAEALKAAREAACGHDVRLGGGATTIRAFLTAGLVDYLHVVVVPILLGRGVRLWDGLEGLEKEAPPRNLWARAS
jgi:hypothetical protein